ncbi:hypothetical protein SAMN04489737_1303 [Arcanobacterium phocae]|uniref:UDP-N-acetylmuramyl pentapeptide phosphotransferase/UDP-N-acetylglucosamine-1-phosphate transferase n=1 Tax=Arcanobacterium phocae TaxID=131112 RepID=A0A1H2LK30_9ACTO|nr:hypothetical protein [Arcanobacterium phocae]SDU80756.1 hypothetical protein SAMN04489737_1303 [Arcanobacterium phocae]
MIRRVLGCAVGAASVYGVKQLTKHRIMDSWDRQSFDGTMVSLTGGLQVASGIVVGTLFTRSNKLRRASLIAGTAGAFAGYIDDHLEGAFKSQGKGFHGHLGALKSGHLTSGIAKIAIIGFGALASGLVLERPRSLRDLAAVGIDTALIAGSANLINLLDLRPGRALKVSSLLAGFLCASKEETAVPASALLGSGLAGLPSDLNGDTMLGDLGANTSGAQLGVILSRVLPLPARSAWLAGTVGLTLASEKISFSHVIESNKFLNAIDQLGRH